MWRAIASTPNKCYGDCSSNNSSNKYSSIQKSKTIVMTIKKKEMRSKEEVALAWIIVALVVLPLIILYPPVLVVGILGYALSILYTHYRRV